MESISFYLLFNYNNFQQSTFFSTANQLNGYIYTLEESVTGYFHLRQNNEALLKENNLLEQKLSNMESALLVYTDSTKIPLLRTKQADEFTLISARVIQSSVIHLRNYLTLNVGTKDGVEPEMGVSNADGIVGVVSMVSKHYSVVIPVLHKDQRFSCKLKSSDAMGSLTWDGWDRRFAYLEEIPPYVLVSIGDTVVTSGHSAIFPEGVMVGVVEDYSVDKNANYLKLKIHLAARFDALSNVRVIRYTYRKELNVLEDELKKVDKGVVL